MSRIALNDGRWFNKDKSKTWEEDTRWDGHNHVSVATGSQWDHEQLYRTAGGVYVLHRWSQWQGSGESYDVITVDEAVVWLSVNGHDAPNDLRAAYAALEI